MRVLITNIGLMRRSGTERYLVELSGLLRDRGHDCFFYSPRLGEAAESLRQAGFTVTDDLASIRQPPELIHGQHTGPALRAAYFFPQAPLLYICHDGLSPKDEPTPARLTDAYGGVDRLTAKRAAQVAGLEPGEVYILQNGVCLDVFKRRKIFRKQPVRALIFSGSITSDAHFEMIREACSRVGLAFDEAGRFLGNFLENPADCLDRYDIVFAKARCALESMATGAFVVNVGDSGLGPVITPENIEAQRLRNFGREALTDPVAVEGLMERIQAYDPDLAEQACDWVRTHATIETLADAMDAAYRAMAGKRAKRRRSDWTESDLSAVCLKGEHTRYRWGRWRLFPGDGIFGDLLGR
ncbi:hypothetical protein [Coraliomargarita parva]|uniref:hypothetical protein n=1 Tax=Coraliomargarita parva TaxID=3014050 RepID=UPI0022B36BAC|nr:hypothetical protein [Coraliomargarita parva]